MKLNPFVQKLGSTHTEITFLPVPRKSERVKKMKIYVWHRVKLPSWLPELITIALWLGLKQFCSPASFLILFQILFIGALAKVSLMFLSLHYSKKSLFDKDKGGGKNKF